jgi:hypothetical protein
MKTKIVLLLFILISTRIICQDQIQNFIKEAQGFYAQKNYKQAQLSLQDAVNELNKLISNQIVDLFPAEINGLKAVDGSSNTSAMGMMGGGMQITKKYENPTKKENEAEVQMIANSPTMGAMGMYLNNPSMMGPDFKSVRVGTQRAILKSEMIDFYDDNGNSKKIRSTQILIPLSQTLLTVNAKGFATEQDELAFANKLDLPKIKTALGE